MGAKKLDSVVHLQGEDPRHQWCPGEGLRDRLGCTGKEGASPMCSLTHLSHLLRRHGPY